MDKVKLIKALDKLSLALTKHNHQWTKEESRLYEEAIAVLIS
jgi:hypothetical protein